MRLKTPPILLAGVLLLLGWHVCGYAGEDLVKGSAGKVSYIPAKPAIKGYIALPPGEGPFPALVVIHEWWGLNDNIKQEADRFAKNGYAAMAVDLYEGTVTSSPDEARAAMRNVVPESALANLEAAVAYLQSHPFVSKDRIGCIGWCFGGAQSLNLAIHNPNLAAAVIYYGRLKTDPEILKTIACPILGQFGELDRGIPVARVREFEKGLKKADVSHEIHIYDKAGHAFANPTGTRYNAAAAKKAWTRTEKFLEKNLKKDEQ